MNPDLLIKVSNLKKSFFVRQPSNGFLDFLLSFFPLYQEVKALDGVDFETWTDFLPLSGILFFALSILFWNFAIKRYQGIGG